MSFDLQMARDGADGFNLAIGEPYFLRETLLKAMRMTALSKPLTYPRIGGEEELLEELHRQLPAYKYIVITNGAKQAIEAAFYAFRTVERRSVVVHQAPYWPSYPTLAKSQGLDFNVAAPTEAQIFCCTSPNNPDGSQFTVLNRSPDLWDAAYAQPLYGFYGVPPPHRIAVFSAAKQLGLSGLRVGWFCTNEEKLADAAAYFVEITTSGVSLPSQMHLLGCLQALRDPAQISELTARTFEARAALMTNGNTFNELISDLTQYSRGVPADGSGMFAWFKARRPGDFARALRDAKVKVVSGLACGEHEQGWYRMSMGHTPEVTRAALLALKHEYINGWVCQ